MLLPCNWAAFWSLELGMASLHPRPYPALNPAYNWYTTVHSKYLIHSQILQGFFFLLNMDQYTPFYNVTL